MSQVRSGYTSPAPGILVTNVVFLNIAGKVQSIEAPPTNEDDSITHLNAKVLNRAEKVLMRHFCHKLFSKIFSTPCKSSFDATFYCHWKSL